MDNRYAVIMMTISGNQVLCLQLNLYGKPNVRCGISNQSKPIIIITANTEKSY